MLRHPITLLTDEVPSVRLGRSDTILLLQDLHAAPADPDSGWLAHRARSKVLKREFDEFFDTIRLVAPNIETLTATCRTRGIPIVFSCIGYWANQPLSRFQEATGWRWNLDGPDGAFPEPWKPRADEPVFSKPGWGALANPDFRDYVLGRKIASVIVVGSFLDFGIRQTCYELADQGISSLVVSDAVAGVTTAGAAHTVGNLAHGMTKLRSTAELLDLLSELDHHDAIIV